MTGDNQCIERKDGFHQVCIIHGLLIETGSQFEELMMEHFGVRTQYLETIRTYPDRTQDGSAIVGTGGRADVFFAVHNDDVSKFAVKRLQMGIRWIEDAISEVNGGNTLYPERVAEYKTW